MKVIVILLLTANLTVQEIRLPTHGLDCGQLWVMPGEKHTPRTADLGVTREIIYRMVI